LPSTSENERTRVKGLGLRVLGLGLGIQASELWPRGLGSKVWGYRFRVASAVASALQPERALQRQSAEAYNEVRGGCTRLPCDLPQLQWTSSCGQHALVESRSVLARTLLVRGCGHVSQPYRLLVLVDDTAMRRLGWTSVANESDERPRPTQLLTDSLSIDSPALA